MKIAFFHELPDGGAKIAVHEIAKALKKEHCIDLYYVDSEKEKSIDSFYNKVSFFSFIPKTWTGGNWKVRLYKDTLELLKLAYLHKKIAAIIDKEKYDFVFVNASKYIEAPFILRYLKTPSVFYCHDPHYRFIYEPILAIPKHIGHGRYIYERVNRIIRKRLDRINFLSADYSIANSLYAQKIIKRSYGRNSVVAYLGIDAAFFTPEKQTKDIDILFIGSYDPVDGYQLLEKALKKLPKKYTVRSVMKENEWLDKKAIKALYNRSKVMVCLGVNEPFGLIPLEAMSCGVPVIAIAEGGYKETVINEKTGLLIRRDEEELASALERLLENESFRRKCGQTGREEILLKWTWHERARKLLDVISSLLQKEKE